jgi:hypothetical protein
LNLKKGKCEFLLLKILRALAIDLLRRAVWGKNCLCDEDERRRKSEEGDEEMVEKYY